jgi:hypothetical protein
MRQNLALLTQELKDRIGPSDANLWDFPRPFRTVAELLQVLSDMANNGKMCE